MWSRFCFYKMNLSKNKAEDAIVSTFETCYQEVYVDKKLYVKTIEDNLLTGICRSDFENDLPSGCNSPKLRSVRSSAMLATNCFAPFKRHSTDLSILGESKFEKITFEKRCPVSNEIRGAPPQLDVVFEKEEKVIAIESKFTEYLKSKKPEFKKIYEEKINDDRRDGKWFKEMMRLRVEKSATDFYKHLNAEQLIKHAFGLARKFHGKSIVLLYLYWEPGNADDYENIKTHRKEIEKFTCRVASDEISFKAMTYRQLWKTWESKSPPAWLREHVQRLRKRYDINCSETP